MDGTWVNKNHHKGFTLKIVVEMERYTDADGKTNRLPVSYKGYMVLRTQKGERVIILHYSE